MRVVDEIRLAQHAGPKRFSTVVQLIESPDGERFVRFSYSTDGFGRRCTSPRLPGWRSFSLRGCECCGACRVDERAKDLGAVG